MNENEAVSPNNGEVVPQEKPRWVPADAQGRRPNGQSLNTDGNGNGNGNGNGHDKFDWSKFQTYLTVALSDKTERYLAREAAARNVSVAQVLTLLVEEAAANNLLAKAG